MENKINIAELLKDCPRGMELDCTTWENVTFERVVSDKIYIKRNNKIPLFDNIVILNQYGCATNYQDEKCRIFPKGKTTWEGFVLPKPKFKCGDIVACDCHNSNSRLFIFKEYDDNNDTVCYLFLDTDGTLDIDEFAWKISRLATEEEKQKLFDAIKANGYKWNTETKTLEKLNEPKFHVGDWVTDGVSKCQIYFIDDTQYWYSKNCILGSIESVDKRYHLWTIHDAKNGDVLAGDSCIFIIQKLGDNSTAAKTHCTLYDDGDFDGGSILYFDIDSIKPAPEEEKEKLFKAIKDNGYKWNEETKTLEKLIKPKFDITTLVPFESRVLVRDTDHYEWEGAVFGRYDGNTFFTIGGVDWRYCIPYEGNEHLFGTTNDCDDFYKTWKK